MPRHGPIAGVSPTSTGWKATGYARLLSTLGALSAYLVLTTPTPSVHADAITESALKAAFVYNFAKFTEWPEALPEIRLCLLEDDLLSQALEQLDGKALGAQRLRVERLESSQQAADCQILYLGESQRENLPRILKRLEGQPTLTVSDANDFIKQGVMIELTLNEAKVEFEVDVSAARRAGLHISAKLLRLAKRVYSR